MQRGRLGLHTVTQTLPDGSKRKFRVKGSARAGAEELDNTCEHAGLWRQQPPPPELSSALNFITMNLNQIFDKAVTDSSGDGEGVTSLALNRLAATCENYWLQSDCYESLLSNDDVPRVCLSMAVNAVAYERGYVPPPLTPAVQLKAAGTTLKASRAWCSILLRLSSCGSLPPTPVQAMPLQSVRVLCCKACPTRSSTGT
jgi:hypothetical protein